MSKEFQLAWGCTHFTAEEYVPLGADRCTLATKQPIANAGTVRILVNDDYFIPQSGLFSQAELKSAISGPFDIIPGEDAVTIRTSRGIQTYSFRVQGVTRYTADQVVQLLQRANLEVALVSSYNGHLVFADTAAVGPDSFVEVTGSAAAALGFGATGVNAYQKRDRGKLLYPAWSLYSPGDEFVSKYPKFMRPVTGNPVFKLFYTAAGNRCLRCGATYVENDIRFDSQGQSLMVQNEDLLYQASLKILLTDKGSNPYHTWYGTDLRSRIGSKAVASVATLINEDVRKALTKLQAVQAEQAKSQVVTYKERLYAILAVDVQPHAQDPSTFMVNVVVRNASNEPIQLSIVYTAPSVVALMGSNGLMLGQDAVGILPGQATTKALFGT